MASSPREAALTALVAYRRQGAWSDGALKDIIKKDNLDSRDAALATRLCFGVLQNLYLLDFYISAFCTAKIDKLQPVVLDILRLGVYQLLFMDRIPQSAAVNEAVNAAKGHANPRAAGMVNGVLRAIIRKIDALPAPEALWIKYSHPQWLCQALADSVGAENLEALLSANNETPPTAAQVNTFKFTTEEAEALLRADGAEAERHPWLPDCLLLRQTGSIEALEAYRAGAVMIQDPAARLAADISGVRPGDTLIDGCAAPGGKSFAAAIKMKNKGRVLAFDIHAHKIALIGAGARRMGLSAVTAALGDAGSPDPGLFESADVVLADVPCSGFGVIRKKPEIRYKNKDELARLPEVQLRILSGLSRCVRAGGVLVYSTCTLLKAENEGVIAVFLEGHPDFTPEAFETPLGTADTGMLTLLPSRQGTDGFFICKLRKKR